MRSRPGTPDGPQSSPDTARLVLAGLDTHHTGEDALLWPKLLERDAPHVDLIHRMEAQHHRVEELIADLTTALPRWKAEARLAVSDEVAATIDELRVALAVPRAPAHPPP